MWLMPKKKEFCLFTHGFVLGFYSWILCNSILSEVKMREKERSRGETEEGKLKKLF